jgi:hypothetical protein
MIRSEADQCARTCARNILLVRRDRKRQKRTRAWSGPLTQRAEEIARLLQGRIALDKAAA